MWSKLRARVPGRRVRDELPAEPQTEARVDFPLSLAGDEKVTGEPLSPSIKSVDEHFGLFQIESAGTLNTAEPAILEIIAVHGLGGGWKKTWTAENGSLWLRDFLPRQLGEVGLKARIWSYGYNSRTAFSAAVTDITDEAGMLLDRIRGERITRDDKNRHIVFVAHSLGGILVKKAMVLAQERSKLYGDLLSKIHGVVFLGTPHRGSDLAWWATFAAEILKTVQLGTRTNTNYVSGLKRNSTEFADISQQWVERSEGVQIRTFYETERLSGVLVVDRDSARLGLPSEVAVGLAGSNHRTICKFEDEESQRYRPVLNAIKLMAAEIRELVSKSDSSAFTWNESHTSFVQLLSSSEYKEDRARNPTREPGTCEWIPRHSQFEAWLTAEASSILWLSGDPGCGKSVASSFLVDFLQKSQPSSLTTYFFFKDDSARQASAISALGAVLHQIFTDSGRAPLVEHGMEAYRKNGKAMFTQLRCLWDTLEALLSDELCGTIIIILDALDECREAERQPFVEALTKLCRENSSTAGSLHLKVVITSRPYAAVHRAFKNFRTIHIRAEDSIDSIDEDVNTVIDMRIERFSEFMNLHGDARLSELKEKLKAKADYTFLWVSLILDILDQSADSTFEELHNIVDNTNPDIESLYEKILAKAKNPERARRLLHIIVGAAEPLTADEVNAAWSVKVGQPTAPENMRERSFLSAELGIRETCGLFVRFINGKVVLVHQTAKEFLVGTSLLSGQGDQAGPLKWQLNPAESSRVLAGICLTYLLSVKFNSELAYGSLVSAPGRPHTSHTTPPGESDAAPREENTESVTEISIDHYIEQGNAAQEANAMQEAKAVQEFMRENHFVGHAAKYVLGYIDHSGPGAWDSDKLGKLALDMFADRHAYISWYVISESIEVRRLVPPLIYALNAGMTHLVEGLLGLGHSPDTTDPEGRPALMIAVRKGWIRIAELLLEAGAACGKDDGHSTALHLAVQADNPALVDLILRYGADRLAKSVTDAIPLHLARSPGTARLLLKEQADEQRLALNWAGETPLLRASRGGFEDVQKVINQSAESC